MQLFLQEVVSEARKKYNIPAIVLTLLNADEVLHREAQGVRILGQDDRVTFKDYFHIGSCSKSALAVIAASLVEQQKIRWNSRFFDVFPGLLPNAHSAYEDITLEHLLLCRAGIKSYTRLADDPIPVFGPEVQNQQLAFIEYLVQQPPSAKKTNGEFKPCYSNASYAMASAMLECVSGKTYQNLVCTTLAEGMGISMYIGWPNHIGANQPWGHMMCKGKIETFGPEHEYRLPKLLAPAGDLSMTTEDYAKYTRLHLQGLTGTGNFISSSAYRHIHFARAGMALGVFNGNMFNSQYSGFDGSAGTFYCRSLLFPESNFGFTIMTNAGSTTGRMKSVEWLSRKLVEKAFDLTGWRKLLMKLLWR